MIGTPLIQILDLETSDNLKSFERPSHKSQKQQIVTDSQGKRRLHGAFTGGFSAGYHNTVDSVGGFVPKTFISHRGQKRTPNDESSFFTHKPEDYMDEEDHEEFGIAPKRIRLVGTHANNYESSVIVNNKSLGERILKNIYLAANSKTFKRKSIDSQNLIYPEKDNNHGIGYKPLKPREKLSDIRAGYDPLETLFKDGKKLKISGQAFGFGVLNDEDDLVDDLSIGDMYGHDNLDDYEFPTYRSRKPKNIQTAALLSSNLEDPYCIKDFSLSGTVTTDEGTSYKLPEIPSNWRSPRRSVSPINDLEKQRTFLNFKFVSSSSHDMIDRTRANLDTKSGLLRLDELKPRDEKLPQKIQETTRKEIHMSLMKRVVEWRPCSLLCKRFDVPNPFPDNLYFGVKPGALQNDDRTNTSEPQVDQEIEQNVRIFAASMDIRRSIYDQIHSENETSSSDDDDRMGSQGVKEIQRNVIDKDCTNELMNYDTDDYDHEDEECVVVSFQRKEPELIVLDSSSSSSS